MELFSFVMLLVFPNHLVGVVWRAIVVEEGNGGVCELFVDDGLDSLVEKVGAVAFGSTIKGFQAGVNRSAED